MTPMTLVTGILVNSNLVSLYICAGRKIEFYLRMMDNFPELEEGSGASTSYKSNSQIIDQHLQSLSRREIIHLEQGKSEEEVLASQMRRATLKRKAPLRNRHEQFAIKRLLQDEHQRVASLKPSDWKPHSVKHRAMFEDLLKVWESKPQLITMVGNNGVCFQEQFSIGTGSYGTQVYICLGTDGIERAIKRLPKVPCKKFLKNERDILTSPNAVKSSRVVNYWFYDNKGCPDFCYLILNLYEQNLEDYVRERGEEITETRARKMIRQVLEGLKALHTREPRILHRDLKPTNILVDVNGNLVLSDFGIGRFFPERGIFTTYLFYTSPICLF